VEVSLRSIVVAWYAHTRKGNSRSQTRPLQTPAPSGSGPQESDVAKSSGNRQPTTLLSRPSSTSGILPGNTDDATLATPPPRSSSNTGAIVGGVVGVLVILALLSLLLFCCRRRRKRRENFETLPSPPASATREKFYEIDNGSLGPSRMTTRWKREISSRAENAAWGIRTAMYDVTDALRDTVARDRSYSPSIISARADAERYRDSVGTHSRNNSVITASSGQLSMRDKFARWKGKMSGALQPQNRHSQISDRLSHKPLARDSQQTQEDTASRYRDSDQSGSVTTSNLGLTLMNSQTSDLLRMENQPRDPFQDPYAFENPFSDSKSHSKSNSSKSFKTALSERPASNPFVAPSENPFSDPVIAVPTTTLPKPQTYVQHVRRSRSSSFSSGAPSSNRSSQNSDLISFADRPTSMTMTSPRYPNSIAPSDRSTVYSSFSAERRGKGRSDPFDLERAGLTYGHLSPKNRPKIADTLENANGLAPNVTRIRSMIEEEKKRGHHRYNSSIRYSSGVDSLDDWDEAVPPASIAEKTVSGNKIVSALVATDTKHARADSDIEVGKGAMSNHKINGSLTEIKVSLNPHDGKV
jgi:hypothetical protein